MVVAGLLQLAQMAEGPGDLVAIAFKIAVSADGGPDNLGDLSGNTRLFCNTNNHGGSSCRFMALVHTGRFVLSSAGYAL